MGVMIFVFVDLLFVVITGAMDFPVAPLEIGTSGTIPCDHVENFHDLRLVQWYKSTDIDAFVNGDPSLAQWRDGATESQSNYHMENNTFSLVIEKATLEDGGIYECSVERGDLFTESYYYTRTVLFALPRKDPEIILDSDSNRVNCTVEHVKPMTYPVIDFDNCIASTETYYAVRHEDETYTTSVSCVLKSASRVECSFSSLHFQRVASLDLRDVTTDSLIEDKTTTVSPMGTSVTFEGDGCRTTDQTECIVLKIFVGLLSGVSSITLIIMLFIYLTLRRKYQGLQKRNTTESTEKMIEPDMGVTVEGI